MFLRLPDDRAERLTTATVPRPRRGPRCATVRSNALLGVILSDLERFSKTQVEGGIRPLDKADKQSALLRAINPAGGGHLGTWNEFVRVFKEVIEGFVCPNHTGFFQCLAISRKISDATRIPAHDTTQLWTVAITVDGVTSDAFGAKDVLFGFLGRRFAEDH
jgi:hypothetical protein